MRNTGEGKYRRKFFAKKTAILGIFGDIGTFGDMWKERNFSFKNSQRVGVRNDVIMLKVLQFYKGFNS